MGHDSLHRPRRWLTFTALLAAAIAGPGAAQETPTAQKLRLQQAVQMALERNPAFRSSADEARAARARIKEAQAAWLPRIDFSQGFTRGNNPVYVFGTKLTQRRFTTADFALSALNTPLPLDNFQTRVGGEARLFDSGQSLFRVRGAKQMVTAADFETEQARQDLIFEVVRAYYGVIVAQENVRAANDALRAAESNEQRMETMHKTGLIVDSDLLSAKVSVAEMKDREIRAQNALDLAHMQLARELGLAVDARPEPAEKLVEPGSVPKSAQEWMQLALEQRPALRAAQLQQDAATSEKKAARAEFGPKLGIYADLERDALALGGPSGTNWTAGARLEFNIFAGGAQRARLAETQANESKAKHDVEWFRSGVMLEVRQAYLEATSSAQRAAAARDSVAQSQESLRIIQNRYEAGLTTVTELLRAQAAQLEARASYATALYDWQVARAQLARAAGILTPASQLVQRAEMP